MRNWVQFTTQSINLANVFRISKDSYEGSPKQYIIVFYSTGEQQGVINYDSMAERNEDYDLILQSLR